MGNTRLCIIKNSSDEEVVLCFEDAPPIVLAQGNVFMWIGELTLTQYIQDLVDDGFIEFWYSDSESSSNVSWKTEGF